MSKALSLMMLCGMAGITRTAHVSREKIQTIPAATAQVEAKRESAAGHISATDEALAPVIADTLRKERNPMSFSRWLYTRGNDVIFGTGPTALQELRDKKLQDSGKTGSAKRRIERAAEDLAAKEDFDGMRELLQKATELGLPISDDVKESATKLFNDKRLEILATVYSQLLAGARDMALVQEGRLFAGKQHEKRSFEEIFKDLHEELRAQFERDQKRAAETGKKN